MNYVVDASVVLKVFSAERERHRQRAVDLVEAAASGTCSLLAPALLELELLNVAARKWRFAEPALLVFTQAITDLDIDLRPVDVDRMAPWCASGLTAYDAAYVAVAERAGAPLVTDDDQIVELAPDVAVALSEFELDRR